MLSLAKEFDILAVFYLCIDLTLRDLPDALLSCNESLRLMIQPVSCLLCMA